MLTGAFNICSLGQQMLNATVGINGFRMKYALDYVEKECSSRVKYFV